MSLLIDGMPGRTAGGLKGYTGLRGNTVLRIKMDLNLAKCISSPTNAEWLLAEQSHSLSSPNSQLAVTFLCSCRWNAAQCDDEYFSETQTDLGRCHTFNANATNVLNTTETGLISTILTQIKILLHFSTHFMIIRNG